MSSATERKGKGRTAERIDVGFAWAVGVVQGDFGRLGIGANFGMSNVRAVFDNDSETKVS